MSIRKLNKADLTELMDGELFTMVHESNPHTKLHCRKIAQIDCDFEYDMIEIGEDGEGLILPMDELDQSGQWIHPVEGFTRFYEPEDE